MIAKYNPIKIEPKWRKYWEEKGLHTTNFLKGPKFYLLVMFPYPSADKLHIGHWYNFGPADTYGRFKKMQGYNVFEPIGFDAFGLPAENYAIKTGIHPKKSTEANIAYIRNQLKQIGAMYDFSKEINTSDPSYYKWTQWLFLQLYKNGLAYHKKAPVNYCPSCKTVLANEQVLDGACERCGSQVIQKNLDQWFFKITEYADRLLNDLNKLDWPEKTKIMQENWIGKSNGVKIKFKIANRNLNNQYIWVFTTRPDTLFGATYLVLAPEHPLVMKLTTPKNLQKVKQYIQNTKKEREIERISLEKEKTGVFTGSYAINPVNNEKIPIWISDYVLLHYGTGAIMCVPAHDERDFDFAIKFNLPIKQVIKPKNKYQVVKIKNSCYTGTGIMINSGKWNGMESEKFKEEITKWLEKKELAVRATYFKLRDWLISRQRYWGAPIPIIYCKNCWGRKTESQKQKDDYKIIKGEKWAVIPVNEEDLPVLLPQKVNFRPTGESPLKFSKEFINTKCPKCKGPAIRETDTMDTFVCSSWYYLRYLSPKLSDAPFDKKLVTRWLPVDMYIGGAEHATMHLIYARFITKVLFDLKLLNFDEPFIRLRHQGIITHKGAKMSKSKGNVIIPDEYIKHYGSDTFRLYLMFMGPYDQGGDWSDRGIVGMHRFLNRVWNFLNVKIKDKVKIQKESEIINKKLHQTIKKVTDDLEELKFNTAIASLMEWLNLAEKEPSSVSKEMIDTYVKLLAPFAPHIAEELWFKLGHHESVFLESWPKYEPVYLKEEKITIVIQVNGKLRGKIEVDSSKNAEEIKEMALKSETVKKWVVGKKIKKIILIPKKLLNIVT